MPVYVYEVTDPPQSAGKRYEITQSMAADALTHHPLTGEAMRRVILPPNIASKWTPGQTKDRTSNDRIEKAGFTKYERDKLTGNYHRIVGNEGPSVIDRKNLG